MIWVTGGQSGQFGQARDPLVGENAGMTSTQAFRPDPARGRIYTARRIVRSTDVTPDGRLRLDSLARYLQTAAEDDLAGSGLLGPVVWLVRRCAVAIRAFPQMGDRITLRTYCSGTGPRWAERTTTVAGQAGDLLQATAVWAAVDPGTGRTVPLGDAFLQIYGESAGGRLVSARLTHPRPEGAGTGTAWPLRAVDFDTAGHVNNAVHWAVIEDLLASADWLPARAEVEYHRAIEPGCSPRLVTGTSGPDSVLWLADAGHLLASARLTR
jgi:acyl-ACP thioesterase